MKAIGVSNFLPDNLQNLLADCRVKAPPPHHQHRPAASGFLPEPRDLSENLLPIAHSEALKNPAIQKMAEKYGAPATLWS